MNTDTIYPTAIEQLVRRVREAVCEPEFVNRKSDEPDFVQFVKQVSNVAAAYRKEGPKASKLYTLWFVSIPFRRNWSIRSNDAPRHIAWNCFIHGFNKIEAGWVVLAWMVMQGRRPSQSELKRELTEMLNRVWIAVQPELKKVKAKHNQKRRERYNKMKEIKDTTLGRPRQTGPNCLRNRIMDELTKGRTTPQIVATAIGARVQAVQSQLLRMLAEGLAHRPAKGLYELVLVAPVVKIKPEAPKGVVVPPDEISNVNGWFKRFTAFDKTMGPKQFDEHFMTNREGMIEYVLGYEAQMVA